MACMVQIKFWENYFNLSGMLLPQNNNEILVIGKLYESVWLGFNSSVAHEPSVYKFDKQLKMKSWYSMFLLLQWLVKSTGHIRLVDSHHWYLHRNEAMDKKQRMSTEDAEAPDSLTTHHEPSSVVTVTADMPSEDHDYCREKPTVEEDLEVW